MRKFPAITCELNLFWMLIKNRTRMMEVLTTNFVCVMKFPSSSEILCDFQPPRASPTRVEAEDSHVSTMFSVLRINKTIFYALLCVCDVDLTFLCNSSRVGNHRSQHQHRRSSGARTHSIPSGLRVAFVYSVEKMKQKIYSVSRRAKNFSFHLPCSAFA